MGTIKQATYGDEKSSTDVTDSLVRMFKEGKGFVEVDVGPKLLQTKEAGSTVELTDGEADEIKKQAQESCGNALDDACMKSTTDALRASKLSDKAKKAASEPIVGERLTVTVIGPDGKEKTLVAPKDHTFQFGRPPKGATPSEMRKAYDEFKSAFTVGSVSSLVGTVIFYFVWVFGTAFTWLALSQSYTLPDGQSISPGDYWWIKYVGTAIAVLTAGYGGFGVVLLVFFVLGLKHYIVQRSLLMSKQ